MNDFIFEMMKETSATIFIFVKCVYRCDLHCFYKNCKGITHGVDETVHHYKDTHMLTELRTKESEIKLDLIYDRSGK